MSPIHPLVGVPTLEGPPRLSRKSWSPGTGRMCAMNLLSWENNDPVISDLPRGVAVGLAAMMHYVNDRCCDHEDPADWTLLCPPCSMAVIDVAHRCVGTAVPDGRDVSLRVHQTWARQVIDWATSMVADQMSNRTSSMLLLRQLTERCERQPQSVTEQLVLEPMNERQYGQWVASALQVVALEVPGWSLPDVAGHAVTEWHALVGTLPAPVAPEVTERAVTACRDAARAATRTALAQQPVSWPDLACSIKAPTTGWFTLTYTSGGVVSGPLSPLYPPLKVQLPVHTSAVAPLAAPA